MIFCHIFNYDRADQSWVCHILGVNSIVIKFWNFENIQKSWFSPHCTVHLTPQTHRELEIVNACTFATFSQNFWHLTPSVTSAYILKTPINLYMVYKREESVRLTSHNLPKYSLNHLFIDKHYGLKIYKPYFKVMAKIL